MTDMSENVGALPLQAPAGVRAPVRAQTKRMRLKLVLNTLSGLLVVGAAGNWAMAGLYGDDLLGQIFQSTPVVMPILYGLVGLSALWQFVPLAETAVGKSN